MSSRGESAIAVDSLDAPWPRVASYAVRLTDWLGREHAEEEHAYRNPFQRDRDRVVHCAAFRRLQGKMQVFTEDFGDYHRTRLTHTLEVVSIARTLARALELNEDLVETLGLLHDIGHPPFGHAGEDVLHEFLRADGGFNHNDFAIQLVREIERRSVEFPGLNLSRNVLASQAWRWGKGTDPPNLECQVVDLADSIAYNAHDLDDAIQLQLLDWQDVNQVPLIAEILAALPPAVAADPEMRRKFVVRRLIDDQVTDAIASGRRALTPYQGKSSRHVYEAQLRLTLSGPLCLKKRELEQFLFHHVYRHPRVMAARDRAQAYMKGLLYACLEHPHDLPEAVQTQAGTSGIRPAVAAFVAGMTDQHCLQWYAQKVAPPEIR